MLPRLLLLFLLLSPALAAKSRLLTQEEADCPRACRCDRTNVVCRGTNFKSGSVFKQLHSLAFPHLDTLVLTGNQLGDLSADNIFGEEEVHRSLSLVNLTGNGITRLSHDTFKGCPNVEYLYLSDNDINYAGRDPFSVMSRLRVLDMKGALARRRGKDAKADLLASMFDLKTKGLVDLQEVILSNNDLEIIYPDTFCKVEGILQLHLAGNKLTKFDVAPKCLAALQLLNLQGNNIATVPSSLWDVMPSLNAFDVSSNPLQCDCDLMPFIEIARNDGNHFTNQAKTICVNEARKGQSVFELQGDMCKSGASSWPSLLLLLLIAGCVLVVYRRYRSRIPSPPAFQFGYAHLNPDETATRPEFV